MFEEIFNNLLLTIATYTTIILGIITASKYIILIISNFINLRCLKSGIYKGMWSDPIKQEITFEILKLKKGLINFKVTPIYRKKDIHDYYLKASSFYVNRYIFKGWWENKKDKIYRGPAVFHLNDDNESLRGKWIGPKKDNRINSGKWILNYYPHSKGNLFLRNSISKKIDIIKEKQFPKKSIVQDIIKEHEKYTEKYWKYEKDHRTILELDLNKYSFIPELGNISLPLIKCLLNKVNEGDEVLDLGTGTGFLAICLAKEKRCKVTGVDAFNSCVELANQNARKNNVESLVKFSRCEKEDLYSCFSKRQKFDFIIANLPFSSICNTYASKDSPYFYNFSGNPLMVENLILGSLDHIKMNTKLIFSYAKSGYEKLLEDLIDISFWSSQKIYNDPKHDLDTYYIYELTINEKTQEEFKKITDYY